MRANPSSDPVECYLRRLAHWAAPEERADLVAEARRHLYDAILMGEAAGMGPDRARSAALEAFGPAWRVGLATRGIDLSLFRRRVPARMAGRARPRRRPCRLRHRMVRRFFRPTRRLF